MKEELKQAIEEACNYPDRLMFKTAASVVLSTPDILRHADPDVMKQAGWVREDDLMQDLMNRTFDKMKTKIDPDEINNILSQLKPQS